MGDLTEETIEEIAAEVCLDKWFDPGCVYENISAQEAESLGVSGVGQAVTWAIATLGDHGYEEALKKAKESPTPCHADVMWAWGEVMLGKLADFTNNLIGKEAAGETLEIGPSRTIDLKENRELFDVAWRKLEPEQKIGARLVNDPLDGSVRISPAMSRVWAVPWLTKKEKKQLALQGN